MYVSRADEIICVYGLLPEFYTVINLVAHVNKSVPGNFFLLPDTLFYCSIALSKLQYVNTSFLFVIFRNISLRFFNSIRIYQTIQNLESIVTKNALCNKEILTVHDRYRDFQAPVEEGVNVVKVYIAVAHNA